MFKKFLSIALCSVMVATTLAGCNNASTTAPTGTLTANNPQEKIQIRWSHIHSEGFGGPTLDEMVKEFNASQDRIEVIPQYNNGYDALMQNLQADTVAGQASDVVLVSWSNLEYFPANFSYLSPEDAVEKFSSDTPNYLTDNYPQTMLDLATNSAGELVGVPFSVSVPILYYNADILREAGLSDAGPQSWDEFLEFSKIVNEKTGKIGGLYESSNSDTWIMQAMMQSSGAPFIENNNGTVTANFATDSSKEAWGQYADMVLSGDGSIYFTMDDATKAFTDGECAMLVRSVANSTGLLNSANFDIQATKFPAFEGVDRAVPGGGSMLAITAQTEEKQAAAWEFIQYLGQADNSGKWAAGTGYMPVTTTGSSSQIYKEYQEVNHLIVPALEQVPDLVNWAAWPGSVTLEIQQELIDMRDQILTGSKDASTALDDAQAKVQTLIDG